MNNAAHLLTRSRRPAAVGASLTLSGEVAFLLGRTHEICGPARRSAAVMLAGCSTGPVFWIAPSWSAERLNAEGIAPFVNPGRFTFVTPTRAEDLLWSMEEVLRSGDVPLVVADIPAPPSLTAVRRLHLAAQTGSAEGKVSPLGLILTPAEGGAPGVETRWHMAPAHRPPEDLRPLGPKRQMAPEHPFAHTPIASAQNIGWCLSRRRARALPPKSWHMWTREGPERFGLEPLPPGA